MRDDVRRIARRAIFALVVLAQLAFVVRGYSSAHQEFAYRMFSESSDWRADIVRVTADGRRVPVDEDWAYRWSDLVTTRALQFPDVRHHADAGVENQLAFLDAALDYVATHTPRDHETRYLEADVTYWRNTHPPKYRILRSDTRDLGP
jgi:hypothetical protein